MDTVWFVVDAMTVVNTIALVGVDCVEFVHHSIYAVVNLEHQSNYDRKYAQIKYHLCIWGFSVLEIY